MVLPACPVQSNMVETCLLLLRAKYIAPFLGSQQVCIAIKQVVACCSQTLFKCSIQGSISGL